MPAAGKWESFKRRQICILAVICCSCGFFSTISEAQVSSSQGQTISLKADAATLCALVGKMQVIILRYNYDPAGAEPRELEPYAVGYTKRRNILLFGRQVKGYSKSADSGTGDLPGWRNFRDDKIKMGVVGASGATFESVPPFANEHRFIAEFVCKNETMQQVDR